jgi:hypothetical protein
MSQTYATSDCPHEGCDASVGGMFDYEVEDTDDYEVRLLMTCHECGKQWNEYYNHEATHIPEMETA